MAASALPINGTDVIIQISNDSGVSYDTIGFCTSCSVSSSMETRDVTTKDDGGRKKIRPGKTSWTMNAEGLVTYSTVSDVDKPNDLFTLHYAGTSHVLRFGSLTTGEYEYSGDVLLTSYQQDAGVEDNNTFSAGWEGNGTLTQAAVN